MTASIRHIWCGYIDDVNTDEGTFGAVLKEGFQPEEWMEFHISDVPKTDRKLIVAGQPVQVVVDMRLELLRIPAWTKEDLDDIKKRADEFSEIIDPLPPIGESWWEAERELSPSILESLDKKRK